MPFNYWDIDEIIAEEQLLLLDFQIFKASTLCADPGICFEDSRAVGLCGPS